ncbi:MAG: hypothetical protein ABSF63_05395 [Candidatus Bathyarchaeia archaeon]
MAFNARHLFFPFHRMTYTAQTIPEFPESRIFHVLPDNAGKD